MTSGSDRPCTHERREHDAEGEEDDQVAVREGVARVRRQRDRERRGERDRAAHARPARRTPAAATAGTGRARGCCRNSIRGRYVSGTTHTSPRRDHDRRDERRVRRAAAPVERADRPSRIGWSCSPTSPKSSALRRKLKIAQKPAALQPRLDASSARACASPCRRPRSRRRARPRRRSPTRAGT